MREAQDRGADSMFLEVEETNIAAVSLYRRLRFAEVARRPAYYTAARWYPDSGACHAA